MKREGPNAGRNHGSYVGNRLGGRWQPKIGSRTRKKGFRRYYNIIPTTYLPTYNTSNHQVEENLKMRYRHNKSDNESTN